LAARILILWSAPRCRSTAFFKMMAGRGDFQVVHEPFSYLAEFGTSTVDGSAANTEQALLAELRGLAARGPVFVKDTTDERYPGVLADRRFLESDATHTFLIRHPRDTIGSYQALNPKVALHQIGFEAQYEIFRAVRDATGVRPVVVDADDLVGRPEQVVKAYCAETGIAYLPDTLNWAPGARREWQPSARWHADAQDSSAFTQRRRDYGVDVAAHPVLGGYLRHHLPFYEALYAHRLTV
jgi:Sulfotransferase domain